MDEEFWSRVDDLMQQGLSYWEAYNRAKEAHLGHEEGGKRDGLDVPIA